MSAVIDASIKMIEQSQAALLITVDEENQPAARLVGPFVHENLNIDIFTQVNSRKARQLENNPNAMLFLQSNTGDGKAMETLSLSGKVVQVPLNGPGAEKVLEKLAKKSKGYLDWIEKDGRQKWVILELKTDLIAYTDFSKSHSPICEKIENRFIEA